MKYKVCLSPVQRQRLQAIARNGHHSAKKILHARILLMSDRAHPEGNWQDQQIAQALSLHPNTIARVRKLFDTGGIEAALSRKKRRSPPVAPKFDPAKIAALLSLYHQGPPAGRDYWSLSALVEALKVNGVVDQLCRETVRRVLKEQGIVLSRRKRT